MYKKIQIYRPIYTTAQLRQQGKTMSLENVKNDNKAMANNKKSECDGR